jgi:hypothetical protein
LLVLSLPLPDGVAGPELLLSSLLLLLPLPWLPWPPP